MALLQSNQVQKKKEKRESHELSMNRQGIAGQGLRQYRI